MSGSWTEVESSWSINQLEMLAVYRALQLAPTAWSHKKILLSTDNSTMVTYVNKFGGTRSLPLLLLTWDLFVLVRSRGMQLKARHIPGRLNRLADLLSRRSQVVDSEWTMHPQLLDGVWDLWGTPNVDLMATCLNNRLPVYISPCPDPLALAVDAMSYCWKGLDAYVFPPWAMIQSVLLKAQLEPCVITAILPLWPSRAWFPALLSLLVDRPRSLPVAEWLIRMPHNQLAHGNVAMLNLHACRLSSMPHLVRAFRSQSPSVLPGESIEQARRTYTAPDGQLSVLGATSGIWILAQPL